MVYKASNYLLTSEMLCFYHNIGMSISNLSIAIEYQRGYPLKPFISHLTSKRVDATITNEPQKQNLYKLTVNSSYGRTGNFSWNPFHK